MSNAVKLAEIANKVQKCQRCPLFKTAAHGVPGEGDPNSEVLFIGEAPGFNEDLQARPFVGQAGKFLNTLIESIGFKREEVFITNVVKHRPPDNRDPFPEEIEACSVWLDEQLAILKPKLIVTLGRYSMGKFLPNRAISQVHGKLQIVNGQFVMPMYHPAAGLRNGQIYRAIEEDFRQIPQALKEAKEPKKDDDNQDSGNDNSRQLNFF